MIDDLDTLARTIWGEARGEGRDGMEAVACVVLNRLKVSDEQKGYWWGSFIRTICLKPYQFSCWNKDDPNYKKLLTVTKDDSLFAEAYKIAEDALEGMLIDITLGATHYHAFYMTPEWAKGEKPLITIGNHIFYRPKEVPKEELCLKERKHSLLQLLRQFFRRLKLRT